MQVKKNKNIYIYLFYVYVHYFCKSLAILKKFLFFEKFLRTCSLFCLYSVDL